MHAPPTDSVSTDACDCESDPVGCLEKLFVECVQRSRIDAGQAPAKRPVFLRLHGVAHGELHVLPALPAPLRVGLFAEARTYPAWIRFSSDVPDSRPEPKSTCGVGIKLFDVPGCTALAPEADTHTADLLFQNFDVFFVDNARDMCSFTCASLEGNADAWLADHPTTRAILDAMRKEVPSVLGIDYWSVIPLRYGESRSCKLKLEPEAEVPREPPADDPAHLAHDLDARLRAAEYRFRLMVQLNPGDLPTDQATVRWSEEAAPPVQVATLVIHRQHVNERGQAAYGERLAMNPFRTLPEHLPLGSIALARRVVYAASAALRRDTNGEPRGEPSVPRPPGVYPRERAVVRAAIHPAIGVARLGNSKEEWLIGPEVPAPEPLPPGSHRDESGAIKRQAARFRVYGYDAEGNVVGELTTAQATITWTVHLANKKASFYRFDRALDIQAAAGVSAPRRNAAVMGADRARLVIDPGPRTISGIDTCGPAFDTGKFGAATVYLGELRTDEAGRLLVLGGHGVSASPEGKPILVPSDPGSFNNADGWYDDTSDGPVIAEVVIGGKVVPCEPAWVIVAPPNFAPDIVAWRTMADLREDAARQAGVLPMPERISFQHHVLPILQRLSGLQWVNRGYAGLFGCGGPLDFNDPVLLARISLAPGDAGSPDPWGALRRTIALSFRPPVSDGAEPRPWPWIYGDAFGTGPSLAPTSGVVLPPTWAAFLGRWVDGDFIDDWDPAYQPPSSLPAVPLAHQPATLDRAALHFCVADAFHPGCELSWPMRHQSMFTSTFRVRHRPAGEPEVDYGDTLTPEIATSMHGPLQGQGPGDLTRWMALPWQMDTAFCRSGYEPHYDPYLPTFWPARVPNQVLTESDYRTATNPCLDPRTRLRAFQRRLSWFRNLPQGVAQAGEWMVAHFDGQGILERRPGAASDPDLPPYMWVESLGRVLRYGAEEVTTDWPFPEDLQEIQRLWQSSR